MRMESLLNSMQISEIIRLTNTVTDAIIITEQIKGATEMKNLVENQIVGINHGSNDAPYVLVGRVTKLTKAGFTLKECWSDNMIIAKFAFRSHTDESWRIVLNVQDRWESSPWALPTKIVDNTIIAWND
jgi:hypothetical protein